jgi:hypothetical protein
MKFKVEVELDWIQGGCSGLDSDTNSCLGPDSFNIDQAVLDEVSRVIAAKIVDGNSIGLKSIEKEINDKFDKMENLVKEKIGKSAEQLIGIKINEVIENWLIGGSGITITDGYGDAKKTYPNVMDLIKEKFNNMLLETVDKDGNYVSNDYYSGSAKQTRLEHLLGKLKANAEKELKVNVDTEMNKIIKEMEGYIQTHLSKQIGDKFLELSGIDVAKNKIVKKG